MAPRRVLTYKARKELLKAAHYYSRPQHQWRVDALLRADLKRNAVLMHEFYRMAGNNPYTVGTLLNYAQAYVRTNAPVFQQQIQNLDPGHPSVINNIMHPLNPSNPNNLMLNPAMNLLVQQAINTEAAVEESEAEEVAENEAHDHQLMEHVIADEGIRLAAEQHGAHPEFNPYHALGLTHNATPEEIQTACLAELAENAPEPNERPTPKFTAVAAAATLIGTEERHINFKEIVENALDTEKHHLVTSLLKPSNAHA